MKSFDSDAILFFWRRCFMESKLKKIILNYINGMHLASGDKLPSIAQIQRKTGASQYKIYQIMKEIAREKKYEVIHGSGIYVPGRKKVWKPFEYSVALISPGNLLNSGLVNHLHYKLIQHKLSLLPLNVPHDDPEYEQEILNFLLKRRIWGVILEPHPRNPGSFGMIKRMTSQGSRCILLSHLPEYKGKLHYFTLQYQTLGEKVAEFAESNNFKQLYFFNQSPVNLHFQQVEAGLSAECKRKNIALKIFKNRLCYNAYTESWQWAEAFSPEFEKDTLYVMENTDYQASHLYNLLQRTNTAGAGILTFTRQPDEIDPRFPCLYMDEYRRFEHISDKLLNTVIWTKTGVETSFLPELYMPGRKKVGNAGFF